MNKEEMRMIDSCIARCRTLMGRLKMTRNVRIGATAKHDALARRLDQLQSRRDKLILNTLSQM